jgi:hypothetical protein
VLVLGGGVARRLLGKRKEMETGKGEREVEGGGTRWMRVSVCGEC